MQLRFTRHTIRDPLANGFYFYTDCLFLKTYKNNAKWLPNHSNLSETAWYRPDLGELSDLSDPGEWSPRIERNHAWITQNWARRIFLRVAIYMYTVL